MSPTDANSLATSFDKQAYAASDADFRSRHRDLARANKINESNALADVRGDVPAGLQGQLVGAGLSNAGAAFGNSIVPGSAGQFGVARNLGVDYAKYRALAGQEVSNLSAATPERSFGLGGNAALQLALANDATRNSVLEGNFQGANEVAISNATGQNSASQGGFAGALSAQQAAQAARIAQLNAGISLANTAVSAYGNYSGGGSGGSTYGSGVGFRPNG